MIEIAIISNSQKVKPFLFKFLDKDMITSYINIVINTIKKRIFFSDSIKNFN